MFQIAGLFLFSDNIVISEDDAKYNEKASPKHNVNSGETLVSVHLTLCISSLSTKDSAF